MEYINIYNSYTDPIMYGLTARLACWVTCYRARAITDHYVII